jgi:hypothetical protein
MESLKIFAPALILSVVASLYFGAWLWVLIYGRALWLRYTAAEAAFFSRLHLPERFVASSRRFSEGRIVIYCAAVGFMLSVFLFLGEIGLCYYYKDKIHHHRQPNTTLEPTAGLSRVEAALQFFACRDLPRGSALRR